MSGDPPPSQPKSRHWKQAQPRLTPEEAVRQGAAARHAWSAFEDRDRVVAFLNRHDEALGGRPIDVAIASDAGLAAVEQAIHRSARAAGRPPAGDARGGAAAARPPRSPTD